MLKKLHLKSLLLLAALLIGGSNIVKAEEVKYTITALNTLSTTGTAPLGSSATITESYNTSTKMTANNYQELRLKNYDGLKITQIVLSMHSNQSGGQGTLKYSVDREQNFIYIVGNSSASSVAFQDPAWYGSWSQTWVDVSKDVEIFCSSEDVVIRIDATAHSLFCQSYTLTYEPASGLEPIASIGELPQVSLPYKATGTFEPAIIPAEGVNFEDYTISWESLNNEMLTVEENGQYEANEIAGEVDVMVKVEPVNGEMYRAVSKRFTVTIYNPNGEGTPDNPYSIAEVLAMEGSESPTDNVYVKGWVVGYWNSANNRLETSAEGAGTSNIALADSPDETDPEKIIAAQLPSQADWSNKLDLQHCPYNLGVAQYLMCGKIGTYFGKNGVATSSAASSKVAEKVSISSAGLATYYTDCNLDFTGLDEMYAYTATVTSDGAITYKRIGKVPVGTGILLRNKNNTAVSCVVPVANSVESVTDNALVGTLTDIESLPTTDENDATNYILNKVSGMVGFYRAAGQKVGAHKAYLQIPAGVEAKGFYGFDDNTTSVQGIEIVEDINKPVYNLQGQRVTDSYQGVVIVNGKKMINK